MNTTVRTGVVKLQWGARDYRNPQPGYITVADVRRADDAQQLLDFVPTKTFESRARYLQTRAVWKEQVEVFSKFFGGCYDPNHGRQIWRMARRLMEWHDREPNKIAWLLAGPDRGVEVPWGPARGV